MIVLLKKHAVITVAFLTMIGTVHAKKLSDSPMRYGFALGGEFVNLQGDLRTDFSVLGAGIKGNQSHQNRSFSLSPSVEVGGFLTDKIYLGLCGGFHAANASSKNEGSLKGVYTLTHELKMSNYWDLLIKFGYQINQYTMVYGKLGPSFAKFSHQTTVFKSDVKDQVFNVSKMNTGLSIGAGFEVPASDHIRLSVDYTHTFYAKQSGETNMTIIENRTVPLGPVLMVPRSGIVTKKISPSHGVLSFKATYFF